MTNRGLVKGLGTRDVRMDNKKLRGVAAPLSAKDASNRVWAAAAAAGWPSYADPNNFSGLPTKYSNERGALNYKSSDTRISDQGISNAQKGGMTHVLWIGDSGSAGCNSSQGVTLFDRLNSVPLAYRDQLALMGVPANGTGIIRAVDGGGFGDSRWTTTGSWSNQSGYAKATANSATATLTADRGGTIADTWYYDSTSCVFTISVDGAASGTGFSTVTASGSAGWKKLRLTGLNIVAGSKIKLTVTTLGTGLLLSGVSIFTPNSGLVMHNVAQSSSTAGGTGMTAWVDVTATGLGSVYSAVAGTARTVTDASTTSGSPNLTSATAAFVANDIGDAIDCVPASGGVMFPSGCYIGAITSGTVAVVHQLVNGVSTPVNALATLSAQTVNIGRYPSQVHIELGMNDMTGGGLIGQLITDITTIVNQYKAHSDIFLHLVHEINPATLNSNVMQAFQQAMYALAVTLDITLYDWRDRVGTYAQGLANGVYGDINVHLNPPTYANIGAAFAWLVGGGSGLPTSITTPTRDEHLTNQLFVSTAAITGAPGYLAPGTNGYETLSRVLMPGIANVAGLNTTSRLSLTPIILPKGLSVGNITFVSGSTAAALPTHWWFGLYDSSFNQLAVTADQAGAGWAANTAKTLAIATIAAGAATSFLTKYAGKYYVGIAAVATTSVPSLLGVAAPNATISALATAILSGLSDSSVTTPPAFPHTATAPSAAGGLAYAVVSN